MNQVPGFGMKIFCPVFSTLSGVKPLALRIAETLVFTPFSRYASQINLSVSPLATT
jgi:hypothetical protein